MPRFTPPVDNDMVPFDPQDLLWSKYGGIPKGRTVWKDAQGVWHDQHYPYNGREDAPGLLQAQVVYLGGHEYDITTDAANELIAAGYTVEP